MVNIQWKEHAVHFLQSAIKVTLKVKHTLNCFFKSHWAGLSAGLSRCLSSVEQCSDRALLGLEMFIRGNSKTSKQ